MGLYQMKKLLYIKVDNEQSEETIYVMDYIFADQRTAKSLIRKMYKEPKQFNSKKTTQLKCQSLILIDFIKRRHTNCQQVYKKCSTPLIIRKNTN
jgi:hypothetical protein